MADLFSLIWREYGSFVQVVEGDLAQGEISAKVFTVLWHEPLFPAALLCFFYAAVKISLSISIPITRLEIFLESIYHVDGLGLEGEVIEVKKCLLLDWNTIDCDILDDFSNHDIPECVFGRSRRMYFINQNPVDHLQSFLLVELLKSSDSVDLRQGRNVTYSRHVLIRDFGRILEDFQIHLALCEIVAQV